MSASRRAVATVLAGVVVALSCASAADARKPTTVAINGSPTALAMIADLAYYYRHAVAEPPAFTFVAGGSEAGVFDAARRISDIGLVTRARLPTDPSSVRFTPFARSAVCLVTNKANSVAGFTRLQVAQLLDRSTARWQDVTGAGSAAIIGTTLTAGNGSDATFLAKFVDLTTPITWEPRTFATPLQLRAFIEITENAWGYLDLSFTDSVHAVPYEGVPCTREALTRGTYQGAYDLAFVTPAKPKKAAAKFMRWVRTSAVARRVIQTRFVAVR